MKRIALRYVQQVSQEVEAEVQIPDHLEGMNEIREYLQEEQPIMEHIDVQHEEIIEDLQDLVVTEGEVEEMSVEDMRIELATWKANNFTGQTEDLYEMFRHGITGIDEMSNEDVKEEYGYLFGMETE